MASLVSVANLSKHPKYLSAQICFEWEESAASEHETMYIAWVSGNRTVIDLLKILQLLLIHLRSPASFIEVRYCLHVLLRNRVYASAQGFMDMFARTGTLAGLCDA